MRVILSMLLAGLARCLANKVQLLWLGIELNEARAHLDYWRSTHVQAPECIASCAAKAAELERRIAALQCGRGQA